MFSCRANNHVQLGFRNVNANKVIVCFHKSLLSLLMFPTSLPSKMRALWPKHRMNHCLPTVRASRVKGMTTSLTHGFDNPRLNGLSYPNRYRLNLFIYTTNIITNNKIQGFQDWKIKRIVLFSGHGTSTPHSSARGGLPCDASGQGWTYE